MLRMAGVIRQAARAFLIICATGALLVAGHDTLGCPKLNLSDDFDLERVRSLTSNQGSIQSIQEMKGEVHL